MISDSATRSTRSHGSTAWAVLLALINAPSPLPRTTFAIGNLKLTDRTGESNGEEDGMKFEKLRLIEENEPRSAAENMAVDEVLLFTADYPVFRSYSWIRPSVSFGYFTAWKVVVSHYTERDLVRRWTGGGIVEHGEDFTYSLVLPDRRSLPAIGELYRFVHMAIEHLLRTNGYPVEMALLPDPVRSGACFEKAVEF